MKVPTSLLPDRITIAAYRGATSVRGATWGDPVTVRARVEGRRRAVRRPDGTDVISSATAIVRPDVTVTPESKVHFDGRDYEVLDVLTGKGLTDAAYLELVLS